MIDFVYTPPNAIHIHSPEVQKFFESFDDTTGMYVPKPTLRKAYPNG